MLCLGGFELSSRWVPLFIFTVSKRTRMFVLQMKSKVFFIQSKKWVDS